MAYLISSPGVIGLKSIGKSLAKQQYTADPPESLKPGRILKFEPHSTQIVLGSMLFGAEYVAYDVPLALAIDLIQHCGTSIFFASCHQSWLACTTTEEGLIPWTSALVRCANSVELLVVPTR
jgi:hypothetical protein